MKIKRGFVTNSSSTSYIAYVPKSHKVDEDEFEKISRMYNREMDLDEPEFPDIMRLVDEFEDMRDGGTWTYYDPTTTDWHVFNMFSKYITNKKLVITEMDLPDSGSGFIMFIDHEKIERILERESESYGR